MLCTEHDRGQWNTPGALIVQGNVVERVPRCKDFEGNLFYRQVIFAFTITILSLRERINLIYYILASVPKWSGDFKGPIVSLCISQRGLTNLVESIMLFSGTDYLWYIVYPECYQIKISINYTLRRGLL